MTATYPDANYLHLHEKRMQQHLSSQSSEASSSEGVELNPSGGAMGRGHAAGTQGMDESEYESSHRRRKVGSPHTKKSVCKALHILVYTVVAPECCTYTHRKNPQRDANERGAQWFFRGVPGANILLYGTLNKNIEVLETLPAKTAL